MANLAVQKPVNPYEDASCFSALQRYRHLKNPRGVENCSLSGKPIEIPNRATTFWVWENHCVWGHRTYDIYRLAVHLLKSPRFTFPGADGFEKFLSKFDIKSVDFENLWKEEPNEVPSMRECRARGIKDPTEKIKASLRLHRFAYTISRSQRKILARYTNEKILSKEEFQRIRRPDNAPASFG